MHPERLETATLRTLTGEVVRLRDSWREKPAVVAFLRQFGCLFCHELVARLRAASPDILARGAHLVFVGNGKTERAAEFVREKRLDVPGITVLTDTRGTAYRAADLVRSPTAVLASPRAGAAALRALREGFRGIHVEGDPWELGGVLVVRPPGEVLYHHAARFAGDHAPTEDVLAAIPASDTAAT